MRQRAEALAKLVSQTGVRLPTRAQAEPCRRLRAGSGLGGATAQAISLSPTQRWRRLGEAIVQTKILKRAQRVIHPTNFFPPVSTSARQTGKITGTL